MGSSPESLIYANEPVDLASIDAVGFDLDHTLALYDDAAVNAMAAAATRRMLVDELGYPGALSATTPVMENPPAARTLAVELDHGGVVKLDAGRRVLRARLGGRWLRGEELGERYRETITDDAAYVVHSPFELPVLWLLEELESVSPPRHGSRGGRCDDVRRMLDRAHTDGTLKQRLREDLPRFVHGIDGIAGGLERWSGAGKRLFVVTNSEPDFASAVLDLAVGPAWRTIFHVVVTSARKPAFFRTASGAAERELRRTGSRSVMIEGGDAARVEEILGLRGGRILFVGDNARSDIRAARSHGWRTAQVVPELAPIAGDGSDGWGAPLAHDGRPTWLARLVEEHADIACEHAGRLLELDPVTALEPAGRGRAHPESA
ncbi:MAG TPA: 5'-nucleotidase domain-containing protein [Candidatus Krumholzibacteria bacterium]|nr:5'-nucleotidase domain-containing protein [Candidatus Krumholzibacteria bacterium]